MIKLHSKALSKLLDPSKKRIQKALETIWPFFQFPLNIDRAAIYRKMSQLTYSLALLSFLLHSPNKILLECYLWSFKLLARPSYKVATSWHNLDAHLSLKLPATTPSIS